MKKTEHSGNRRVVAKEPVWKTIPDDNVRHAWQCPDCNNIIYVNPECYQDSGRPVCKDCDVKMIYVHTEIKE